MSFTNRTAQALLNSLFGKTSNFGALATVPTIYVALSTTTPNEAGTNVTEPVGNAYARVTTAAGDWATATNADPSVVTNANAVTFPEASGSWGDLTHFVLYDALTVGNVLGSAALTTPKTPTAGDIPLFPVGALTCSLD